MNAPLKEDETPITNTAMKPPRKSWFFVPLSPDNESNVYDDSDTELPDLPSSYECQILGKISK